MTEQVQVGVIPYILRNNTCRFVIVTGRKHPSKWIFPKGQQENDKTDREIAVNEAFEEAGIIGTIKGKAIKITVTKKTELITYKLYPFKISRICRKWPERKIRKRRFVKSGKALKLTVKNPYSKALAEFLKKVPEKAGI